MTRNARQWYCDRATMWRRFGARVAHGLAILCASLPATVTAGLSVDGKFGTWSLDGYAEGYAIIRTDSDSPSQRPSSTLLLQIDGKPTPRFHLFIAPRVTAGGTPKHADGFGVYNLSDTFQNIDPRIEIEEGYVEFLSESVELRAGLQKFAWGKLDRFQPTDIVNPRQYGDPFIDDEEDMKVPVAAVRGSYFLPPLANDRITDVNVSAIWVPVPIPPRFPLPAERWFPSAASLPPTLTIPANTFGPGLPGVVVRTTLRTENRPPAHQFDEGSFGLRVSGLVGTADWAIAYYEGNETALNFDLLPSVVAPGVRRKLRRGETPTIDDLRHLRGTGVLRQDSSRTRLVGGDTAFQFHGFTARVEAAYGWNRVLPRTTQDLLSLENLTASIRPTITRTITRLLSGKRAPLDLGPLVVERDAVEWGAGIDYRYRGWMPLVQVNQTLVLHNPTELLINDVDTRLLLTLRRTFLADRLEGELVLLHGIERGYDVGLARATYAVTDRLRVRLGFLLIAGSRRTTAGEFHDNDEAFVQIRYSF